MASLRVRNNIIYIQYYDPGAKRNNSKSTGLENNHKNQKIAKDIAKQLQLKLDESKIKNRKIGIKQKTLQEAFGHFLENNQYKNKKTIWEYNWYFKEFTKHFDKEMPCSNINKIEVERWLNKIKKYEFKKNTIHTLGKQCRHFLNFLFEYDYCQTFTINREVMTKPEVCPKVVFEKKDIITLFNMVEEERDGLKILIYLAFYTGLRPSDLYNINVEDINIGENSLRYYSQKRDKFRVIAFHEDLVPLLTETIGDKGEGRLLPWSEYNYLGKAVTRFFKKLDFTKKGYSARTFRKTFISLARSEYNMDASIVRELVGHEHRNTTDRYYNEIPLETMKKELKKFKRPI